MYVLDRDQQVSLIGEMTQLRKDPQKWEVYYHHPSTNAMWKSYFPRATAEERGPKILRTEPVPEQLEERMDNCLIEEETQNAIGLGIELSTIPDQWPQVLAILEENYRRYHRSQVPVFLEHLGIEAYEPLFAQINYNLEASDLSKSDFHDLAYRSRKLRFKRFWFF